MITKFKIFEQEGLEESHIEVIDFIIDRLIEDFKIGDFSNIKKILDKIDKKILIGSLPENPWKEYKKIEKEKIIDIVIHEFEYDFKNEDYTVLDELLGFISEEELNNFIPEEWIIRQDTNKYNL